MTESTARRKVGKMSPQGQECLRLETERATLRATLQDRCKEGPVLVPFDEAHRVGLPSEPNKRELHSLLPSHFSALGLFVELVPSEDNEHWLGYVIASARWVASRSVKL